MRMLILVAGLTFGSSLNAADLLEVYREARRQDPAFNAAQAAFEAAREKVPQGEAGLKPTVNLEGAFTHHEVDVNHFGDIGLPSGSSHESHGYTVSVSQPLFRVQNYVQYQQALAQVRQAGIQLGAAEQDLMLRVAQAYFEVLLAEDNVKLAGAQKEAIAEQLAQAKRNFEVGTATITDTHEAQARYDEVVAREIAARNELNIKRHALQQIIGHLPGELQRLGPDFSVEPPSPNSMDEWVARAEQENLQARIQQQAFELARLEVRRNQAARYPTVDLVASYGDNTANGSVSFGGVGNRTENATVGVQLAVPLYAGGAIVSRVREAASNREKARFELENARRNAALQARQAFLGVNSGAAQIQALEQALVSNQASLESSTLGRQVGVRTSVDVLNAQEKLFSARRDLLRARYAYLLNTLQLKAAAGRLSLDDLEHINRYLTAR